MEKSEKSVNESSKVDHDDKGIILPAGLDSGDVVLFNRRCLSMGIKGALVCAAAKMGSNTQWDHVGIVVKDPESGELLFLEADFGGVKLRSLKERVCRSSSRQIAVRRLNIIRTDADRQTLFRFANGMLGTPYETAAGTMIRSVIDPLAKQDRERLHALLVQKKVQLREIERELRESALTMFQRRTLESEKRRVAGNVAAIQERLSDELRRANSELFEDLELDLSQVFCSELVAAAYQQIGLLESYPPAAGYNPKDFSSEQTNPPGVHLLRGARLSPEIFLRDDQSTKQKSKKSEQPQKSDKSSEDISQWLWPSRRSSDKIQQKHKQVTELNGVQTGDSPARTSRQLIRESLKRTPLYADFPDEYKRSHLVKSFRAVVIDAGDVVFTQGDYGDSFFIVEEGRLERFIQRDSTSNSAEHHGAVLVSTLGPKTSFGLTAFAYNVPRTATIRAATPTLLWKVDRPTFELLRDAGSDTRSIQEKTDLRELRELLTQHFLFRNMDRIGPREVGAFFPVTFRAGELIFSQGDRGDNFYIIKSGEVQRSIVHPDYVKPLKQPQSRARGIQDSKLSTVVNTLGPGDSFGELSIMYDAPRAATCRARTDVQAWAINAESFHQLTLGGGTQYLRAVFNQFASVDARAAHRFDQNGLSAKESPHSDANAGLQHQDFEEKMMTGRDFLRFANLDAMNLQPDVQKRLESLLLMLVTGNRLSSSTDKEHVLLDFWEFVRFDILLNQPNAELQFAFRLADRNNSGFVDLEELQSLLTEYESIDPDASQMLMEMDNAVKSNSNSTGAGEKILRSAFGHDGQNVIQYKEFCRLSNRILPPRFLEDIRHIMQHMLHDAQAPLRDELDALASGSARHFSDLQSIPDVSRAQGDRESTVHSVLRKSGVLRWVDHYQELPHLTAVAFAAVLSRTLVAPLERAKILMQTGVCGSKVLTLRQTLSWMVRHEGVWNGATFRTAMFRGNTANVIRIAPAVVLQLLLVEQFRSMAEFGSYMYKVNSRWTSASPMYSARIPTVFETIAISGVAGMIAAVVTYPLDLIHARLSIQHAAFHPYSGVVHGLKHVVQTSRRGLGLFNGLTASLLGVFSYVGISFATYEVLRPMLPKLNDGSGRPTPGSSILCGMMSSLVAQGASFPLDTCRRVMQIKHFGPTNAEVLASPSASLIQTAAGLLREGGMKRLYRGWTPNFWKALPVSIISFYAYEQCRTFILREKSASGAPNQQLV